MNMIIRFCVTGTERKALVQAISKILGWEPIYKKAPSFAYAIGDFVIDKEGSLIAGVTTDEAAFSNLLAQLAERGFISEDRLGEDSLDRLVIELPLEGFSAAALDNLEKLVASKAALMRKAIGADNLIIEQADGKLQFPWFTLGASPNEVRAYTQLVTALCASAKAHSRVTAREKAVDNEKYALRCFLIRLGFIGEEYAVARKILLANLPGDSSFKSGNRRKTSKAAAIHDSTPE